ncbi:MAG: hypothetical protein ACC682_16740 [Gemmatimonadota bacterium]
MWRPVLSLSWIGAIIAAEILGRRSPSDVWDALGVGVLVTLTVLTIVQVENGTSRMAGRLRRLSWRVRRHAFGWWPEMGIDFRGSPSVPRGFPGSLLLATVVAAAVATAALASRSLLPGPARALALSVSPTLYFLGLAVGWATLLTVLGVAAFSTWRDLNDHLLNSRLTSGRRDGVAFAVGLAWLGSIAALVSFVPLWLAWVFYAAVGVGGACTAWAVDRHERIRIVWRAKRTEPERLFFGGAAIRWDALTMAFLLPAMTVPWTGVGWDGRLAGSMPITLGLGTAATWAGALAFLSYILHGAVRMLSLARHDPSKREPIPLMIEGDAELPEAVTDRLTRHGFRCVAASAADTSDRKLRVPRPVVRVSVSKEARERGLIRLDREAEFLRFAPRVRVSPEALASVETLAELRRLDNSLLRDRLLGGLRDLLGLAAQRRFANGTGFWLVPHIWFARGLTRDSDDPDYHSIGPPYHKTFSPRERQHLHALLKGLEVDLIFAEDSAPVDAIDSVFERLFDVYDVLGPRRVEERDFVGIRRVRVILHDFTLGEPFRRPGYLEPSYDEVGRARILHIMIDRGGGEEELDPIPSIPDEEPTVIRL